MANETEYSKSVIIDGGARGTNDHYDSGKFVARQNVSDIRRETAEDSRFLTREILTDGKDTRKELTDFRAENLKEEFLTRKEVWETRKDIADLKLFNSEKFCMVENLINKQREKFLEDKIQDMKFCQINSKSSIVTGTTLAAPNVLTNVVVPGHDC